MNRKSYFIARLVWLCMCTCVSVYVYLCGCVCVPVWEYSLLGHYVNLLETLKMWKCEEIKRNLFSRCAFVISQT